LSKMATHLCTPVCAERFEMSCAGGYESELPEALQAVLRREFSVVQQQLEMLARGQAALHVNVEKLRTQVGSTLKSDEPLPNNSANTDDAKLLDEEKKDKPTLHTMKTSDIQRETTQQELAKLIRIDDGVREREHAEEEKWKNATLIERLRLLHMNTKDLILDGLVSIVIVSNAIFIGVSVDHWNGEINWYCAIDVLFAVIFFAELVVQIRLHGWEVYFFGPNKFTNILDFTLVVLDTIQLGIVFFATEANKELDKSGVPSASLFRIVRIIRIGRILRLLRHPSFQDLLAMFEGVSNGVTTLGWAIIVFFLMVYVVALICKDTIAESSQTPEAYPYFDSVPRAMFTVFRCSFGDCSTTDGTVIPELFSDEYGWFFTLLYSFFVFFVTIGLFNVISAIFVDSTLSRAAVRNSKIFQDRLENEELWATSVCTIVRRCLEKTGYEEAIRQSGDQIQEYMLNTDIDCSVVDEVCQTDEEVTEALDNLDIDPFDHCNLADILDPDHTGTMSFVELVMGLHRLRGQPRRSDIVTVDLMMRATQEKLGEMSKALEEGFSSLKLMQTFPILEGAGWSTV